MRARHLAALIALALAPTCAAAAEARFSFARFDIEHASERNETFRTIRPLGTDRRMLMLIYRTDTDRRAPRSLALYTLGEEGPHARPAVTIRFPDGTLFWDLVERGDDGDLLVVLTAQGLEALALDAGSDLAAWRPLVTVSSLYRASENPDFGPMELALDLNGDGREELLVPDFDGYHLISLSESGEVDGLSHVRVPARMDMDDGQPEYHRLQPFVADLDLDGRDDLSFLTGGSFLVFPGGTTLPGEPPHRRPAPTAEDALWGDAWEIDREQDQSDLVIHRLIRLQDLNGDGLTDALTEATFSEGVFDKSNSFSLYLGRAGEDGLLFPESADHRLDVDGIQVGLATDDLDGDGRPELGIGVIEFGLMKAIGALLSSSIGIDLHTFRLSDGGYPRRPDDHRTVEMEFDLRSGYRRQPVIGYGDLDGDGYTDLVLQTDDDEITVYAGGEDGRMFGRRGESLELDLPANGAMFLVEDVDGDGRDDLLMRYGEADDPVLQDRLTVSLSR